MNLRDIIAVLLGLKKPVLVPIPVRSNKPQKN
jgi:hypothetical protein